MFVLSCQWATFLPPNVNDKSIIVLPEHDMSDHAQQTAFGRAMEVVA